MRALALAVPFALLLVSFPSPAAATVPDPTAAGSYTSTTTEYRLGTILVDDPSLLVYAYPVELHGEVTSPSTGSGPFPVLVFLHGRHGTCAVLGIEGFGTHICPKVGTLVAPVDSFRGYRYIAQNLASHGYVVVSIDANQVNDRDLLGDAGANARGQLVLATLEEFEAIHAAGSTDPALDALEGRMDFTAIGLMGHSRGGEGVAKAVTLNAARTDPFDLKAVFALAPTDFDRHAVPGVAFATLLPYCDGDVYDLEGSWMYDDARYTAGEQQPRMQVLAMGANHNFYNTVWTGDDWGGVADSWCHPTTPGNGRDSAADQRRHGLGLIASFLRLYVGGESAFLPLWTGKEAIPSGLCPGGTGSCDGRLLRSFHAGASDRRVLEDVLTAGTTPNDLGGAVAYAGFSTVTTCLPATCPAAPTYGQARQLAVSWTSANARITHTIPSASKDVSGFDVLSFRVGVDPTTTLNDAAQSIDVQLTDGDGTSATSTVGPTASGSLAKPPGGADGRKVVLGEVRVPLSGFGAVDLTDVASVTLTFTDTSGRVQMADFLFQDE